MSSFPVTVENEQIVELLESLGFRRGFSSPSIHKSMSKTQEVFAKHNCLPDTGEDVTQGLQAAVTELLHEGRNIIFPEGTYRISAPIEFFTNKPNVRVLIQGYGVIIDAHLPDEDWEVNQDQDALEEWQDIRSHHYNSVFHFMRKPNEFHVTVEGFFIDCNGSVGCIGIETSGITQSAFRDMDVKAAWVGYRFEGWNNVYEKLTTGAMYIGCWLYSGSRGLNSNVNQVNNVRVYGSGGAWNNHNIKSYANFVVEGAANTLRGCTVEGKIMRYGVLIDTSRNAAYKATIGHIHTESQDWAGVSRNEARTVGIVEQRHDIILDEGFSMRYGLRCFKPGRGKIIWKDLTLGHKRSDLPRKWEGVSRSVHIEGVAEHGARGVDIRAAWDEALGVDNYTMVVSGHPV